MTTAVEARALRVPPAPAGLVVGLFGGSFDPPHAGHRLVAETALRRLGLDRLWALVTPGNPLKDRADRAPLAERLAATRAVLAHPRIDVTAFEAAWGSAYTVDTVARLRARHPRVRFVLVIGADNLRDFHRWRDWRRIAGLVTVAVVDRPGATLSPLSARAALALASRRLPETGARALVRARPPALVVLHGPRDPASSTAIRARRRGLRPSA